jgi:hypothetical protein
MINRKSNKGQKVGQYSDQRIRTGNWRRSEPVKESSRNRDDLTLSIKEFLTEFLENQKRLVKVGEREADAEARKLETIESFLPFVKNFIEGDTIKDLMVNFTSSLGPYELKHLDEKHKKV